MYQRRSHHLVLLGFLGLGAAAAVRAQAPVADPADVATIAAIVRASYEVINGPAGAPRQWRRDSTLYTPGATFSALTERDGKPHVSTMTPEEYRRAGNAGFLAKGLFETEIGFRSERFGNVAQVRSVAEMRRTPDGPVESRYVNYFMLYRDGTRWWITGMVWDQERPNNPIPRAWVGIREEVP